MSVANLALAVESSVKKPIPPIKLPSIWGYTLKVFVALCVVLGLILFFFYLLRKIRYGVSSYQRNRKVEVVEVTPLMGKWAVALVRAGKRYFLLGLSDKGVSFLSNIDEKDLGEDTFSEYLREGSEKD